jgi:putative phosphoribosyl transferase
MLGNKVYRNRREAGQALAKLLVARGYADPVVLALPRGGVPVGLEVARALHAPLDVLLVRKIGAPGQPELAAAAIVDGAQPELVVNEEVVAATGMTRAEIDAEAQRQLREIERRRVAYVGSRAALPLAGRTVIVVDDGIATGTSVRAALRALRARQPARLVLAVPVAPADTLARLAPLVDEVVCPATPEPFIAIGLHYADFHQLDDREVVAAMDEAAGWSSPGA